MVSKTGKGNDIRILMLQRFTSFTEWRHGQYLINLTVAPLLHVIQLIDDDDGFNSVKEV